MTGEKMVANIWPDGGTTVKVTEWPKISANAMPSFMFDYNRFTRTPLLKWLNSQWFALREPVSWRVTAGRGNNVECLHAGLIPTETNFLTPLAVEEEWVSSVTSLLLHTHQLTWQYFSTKYVPLRYGNLVCECCWQIWGVWCNLWHW